MADLDTGMNRDPSPTRDELLALRDRMVARLEDDGRVRDYGRPVRIIRSANLLTHCWRSDVDLLTSKWAAKGFASRERSRCETLAETGEHLGLDRVGLIVETVEVQP